MMRNRPTEPPGFNDWNKGSSFINKPPRGWIHPDQTIMGDGMRYSVRYIGRIGVNASMKSLDFDTRSVIAKECINRVCEATCLKNTEKKRKIDKRLIRMLAETPNLNDAGANINLVVTSSRLNLVVMETGKIIASHDMPNISFASGGDADMQDFIAYVAKDHRSGRFCYVVECGATLAQEVITTIGQAFELRFKQFLKRKTTQHQQQQQQQQLTNHTREDEVDSSGTSPHLPVDPDYYNDLPGKLPPEIQQPPLPPLPDYSTTMANDRVIRGTHLTPGLVSGNLIDLGTEVGSENSLPKLPEPEYVNSMVSVASSIPDTIAKDPFDMQPFEQTLPQNIVPPLPPHQPSVSSDLNPASAALVPDNEIWFHGSINRKDSELLVINDGDFIVRESQGTPGQYVLTGMQGGVRKHLLLVDPQGVVRTKDRTFDSVSHLVNYHCDNGLPIISAESALLLKNPIAVDRLI